MRRVALAGLTLSALVIITLATTAFLVYNRGESLPLLQLGLITGIALITVIVGFSSAALSRRYVTRLELWPKSNLALARTAGLFREGTHLIPWHDFRANRTVLPPYGRDPYLRVQLRSGKHLAFEQPTGEAPQGWIALQKFVEFCKIPTETDPSLQGPNITVEPLKRPPDPQMVTGQAQSSST